ncbi:MAG: Hpt domain-containing protein [Treponema sp.]|jgi:HPt (histidine-containing phosphotransfer) domain-containing protein|nr:Hpt domain-containing protein [Treponema sp.]
MALLIDKEDGLKRVMNNAALYTRLLGKFRAETRVEPIFTALDAGNWEEAQHLTHTIKGVTANLSIKDLNEKIVELETQIKAREVKPEAVEAVKTSFAETGKELEMVLSNA